jgi:hypothetical protein
MQMSDNSNKWVRDKYNEEIQRDDDDDEYLSRRRSVRHDQNNFDGGISHGSSRFPKKQIRDNITMVHSQFNPKPKIMSKIVAISSQQMSTTSVIESNYVDIPVVHTTDEAIAKPEIFKRNKRMFGALMGHLDLAKRKLDQDSDRIHKQAKMNSIVAEKNLMEAKRLAIIQKINSRTEKDKVSAFLSNYLIIIASLFVFLSGYITT